MYIRNGQIFDINQAHNLGVGANEVQYPAGWFLDASQRALHNIVQADEGSKPTVYGGQKAIISGFEQVNGVYRAKWAIIEMDEQEQEALAYELAKYKSLKNQRINAWREAANFTSFPHKGKQIACDNLSRSDINGTSGHIALFGEFPADFPGGWLFTDNTVLPLPTVEDFKEMYAAMSAQGTANFNHARALKAALAAATTKVQIDAISW